MDQIPSPSQRVIYQAEISKALYCSGEKALARQTLTHAWVTAKPFLDLWPDVDTDSESGRYAFESLLRAAHFTGNKNIAKKLEVVLGEDEVDQILEEDGYIFYTAISQARMGDLKAVRKTLADEAVSSFPDYLDWSIRALDRNGRKGPAKALLDPFYWYWFPPKEKPEDVPIPREGGNKSEGGNQTFRVNHLQEAVSGGVEFSNPFSSMAEFCRFVVTYHMVNGPEKAEPLVKMALEAAKDLNPKDLENPELGSGGGFESQTDRTFYVLQDAAAGASALDQNVDDVLVLAGLFVTTGHQAEANRLGAYAGKMLANDSRTEDSNEIAHNTERLIALARLHHRLGSKAKAIKMIDDASGILLSIDMEYRTRLPEVAVLYGRLGEEEKAKATFNESLRTFRSLKKQATMVAFAARMAMNAGEMDRTLRDLPPSFRVKLAEKNKDSLQYAIFDLIGSEVLPSSDAAPLDDVNHYLYELAGWLSYGHYLDDGEFSDSFSEVEKYMARQLVRVVMGGTSNGTNQSDLEKLTGKVAARKKLPSWAGSVSPDAAMLMTYNIAGTADLIGEIPDKALHNMVKADSGAPDWLIGPMVKFFKGARLDAEAFKSLLDLVPDDYRAEAELALDVLGGNVGLADQPMGFWVELQPPVGEDKSEIPALFAGALPIKGGNKIAEWLEKSAASFKPDISLTQWGKYKVIESGQLAGLLGEREAEDLINTPFILGIKDDQIVVLGMVLMKMDIEHGGEPEMLEFKNGKEQVKAHFWRKFADPNAKANDLHPRHAQLLSQPSIVNIYFDFEWATKMAADVLEQSLLSGVLTAEQAGQQLDLKMLDSAAFSMRFDVNSAGFVADMTIYHDKLDGKFQKPLPAQLLKLLPNVSTAAGAYSFDMSLIRTLVMGDIIDAVVENLPADSFPEGKKLDSKTFKEELDKEFEQENGFKLSTLLDNIPESVLVVGPDIDQKLSDIGGVIPGVLVGAKLRKDSKLSDLFDFIKKQGGVPESLDIEAELAKLELYLIQKDGYLFLCSGEFKTAIEEGRAIGRKPRPDVAGFIKSHDASIIIDGDLLLSSARIGGIESSGDSDAEVQMAVMENIDKIFLGVDGNTKGQSTFRMGASFRPDGLSKLINRAVAIQNRASRGFGPSGSDRPWGQPRGFQFNGGRSDRGSDTATGAVVGGILGSVIGHSNHKTTAEGAAIGALGGALLGEAIGNAQDKKKDVSNSNAIPSALFTAEHDKAVKGDAVAQFKLGELYRTGERVKRDTAQAYAWLTISARNGYPIAKARVRAGWDSATIARGKDLAEMLVERYPNITLGNKLEAQLGKVMLVDKNLGFVVVDFGPNVKPVAGLKHLVYRGGNQIGEVTTTGQTDGSYIVANINKGDIRTGDSLQPSKLQPKP